MTNVKFGCHLQTSPSSRIFQSQPTRGSIRKLGPITSSLRSQGIRMLGVRGLQP